MKKITLLIAACVFSVGIFAQELEVQETVSFESSEGYSTGNIDGQDGWEAFEDLINVSDERANNGDQSMHLGLYGGFPSGDFQGGAFRAFADEPISTGVVSISFQGYFPETSDNSDAAVNFMVAGSNPEGTTSQLYFEPGNPFAGQGVVGDAIAAFMGYGQASGDPAPSVGLWLTLNSGIYYDQWIKFEMIFDFEQEVMAYLINDNPVFETEFYDSQDVMEYGVLTTGDFEFFIDDITFSADVMSVEDHDVVSFNHFVQNNQLFLNSPSQIKDVAIYNLLGQEVINTNINATEGSIDLGSLSSGIYLTKVNVNGQVKSFKFSVN